MLKGIFPQLDGMYHLAGPEHGQRAPALDSEVCALRRQALSQAGVTSSRFETWGHWPLQGQSRLCLGRQLVPGRPPAQPGDRGACGPQ